MKYVYWSEYKAGKIFRFTVDDGSNNSTDSVVSVLDDDHPLDDVTSDNVPLFKVSFLITLIMTSIK